MKTVLTLDNVIDIRFHGESLNELEPFYIRVNVPEPYQAGIHEHLQPVLPWSLGGDITWGAVGL